MRGSWVRSTNLKKVNMRGSSVRSTNLEKAKVPFLSTDEGKRLLRLYAVGICLAGVGGFCNGVHRSWSNLKANGLPQFRQMEEQKPKSK